MSTQFGQGIQTGMTYIQNIPQRDPTRVALEQKIEVFQKEIDWRNEQIALLRQAMQLFPDPPSLYQQTSI